MRMANTERPAVVHQMWPLLAVQDIAVSIGFYESLGFVVVGRADIDGAVYWCRVERGGASLMLQQADDDDGAPASWGRGVSFYLVCDDADAVHAECVARGIAVAPVSIADYGMKQVFVPEPDGYTLCFESPVVA